jgi:hypothetical protein
VCCWSHTGTFFQAHHLTRDIQHVISYQCLPHCNACHLSEAHKFIKEGIPKLVPITNKINNCTACLAANKMRKPVEPPLAFKDSASILDSSSRLSSNYKHLKEYTGLNSETRHHRQPLQSPNPRCRSSFQGASRQMAQ